METKQISNIWSRIFFQGEAIRYEILFELDKGNTVTYNIYTNFKKYREVLTQLSYSKANRSYIELINN